MNSAKVIGLLGIFLLISCNALKKVPENALLLRKNQLTTTKGEVNSSEIKGLIVQQPNSQILGYPLKLNLYNLAKDNPDSTYQAWLEKKEGRRKRLNKLLSEKQVKRLGNSFAVKGLSNFLKTNGEPPVVIDSAKMEKSLFRLRAYYFDRGHFLNKPKYTVKPNKKRQRAEVSYDINLGPSFVIDEIKTEITSEVIDSLYEGSKEESLIKLKDPYDYGNFSQERERLTRLFRNSGINDFQESSIRLEIDWDTIPQNKDSLLLVKLIIGNRKTNNQEQPYRARKFRNINIFPDYKIDQKIEELKQTSFGDYTFYHKDKLNYKPESLAAAVFFEKDSLYRDLNYIRTNRQIANLNTFKFPNIEFIADSTSNALDANIYLSPRPKYSLDTSLEIRRSNIQLGGLGFNASIIDRNIFKGSENLSISTNIAAGILGNTEVGLTFFSEIGADINLTFPRIWSPFNTSRLIPSYMIPQTRLSVGTNFQKNIGLDRQSLNSILRYNWAPSNFVNHALELINIEFVRNTNPAAFFSEYQSSYDVINTIANKTGVSDQPGLEDAYDNNGNLTIPSGADTFLAVASQSGFPITSTDLNNLRDISERKERLTTNNLIFTTNYAFRKNNRENLNDENFYQYLFKIESAGNLLSLLDGIAPFETNDNNQGLVFSIPYSQYIKGEIDFIKHWKISNQQVLAFRNFIGLAIPYGNADNIPFVRSYFAGGSNDNRAWNVYSLGPGRSQSANDFNEANLKIALNLEYRFPLIGSFKGALFADAGNIWNVFDNIQDENTTFNGVSSFTDLALGTGFGLRYDLSYFVIRLDTGFKTYDPSLRGSDRWFTNFNLKEAVFQVGINYPF